MALQGNKHQLLNRIKRICLGQGSTYRGESGKAGIAFAFLLILAVVVWAKVPQTEAEQDIPEITSEAITVQVPAEESLIPVEHAETEATEAEVISVPSPPEEEATAAISSRRILATVQHVRVDSPPPIPRFPRIKTPVFPNFPRFPKSPESISRNLERDAAYIETLRDMLEEYGDEIQEWKEEYERIFDDAWLDRQDRVLELYERWKGDLRSQYGGESVAYARNLNQYGRAFEEAMEAQEEVMEDSESAIQKEMEDYIQEFEDVLQQFEDRQRSHDERMAVHSERMAAHGLRMSVHGARMSMHGKRMSVHGQRMNMHGDRMKAHGIIIDKVKEELMDELIRDRLYRKGQELDFRIETDQIVVNGTKLTGRDHDRYLRLIRRYIPDAGPGWSMFLGDKQTRIGTTRSYSEGEH